MRRVRLSVAAGGEWPALDAATIAAAIEAGDITVNGQPVTNPDSLVEPDAVLRIVTPEPLQGTKKLSWAISRFRPAVAGRVAVDVGASTGGFTTALLDAGVALVYAVDAGHGQLLGSLRQDPRVVNLERTNVAALDTSVVPSDVGAVTVDVSYLSLTSATSQLQSLSFESGAELLGLVKPMFELRLPTIPTARPVLDEALGVAVAGVEAAGWSLVGADECPVRGMRGAVEFFIHARRR